MDTMQVQVIRMWQKGVPVYAGKMRAGDLLHVWDIREWSEKNLDGYQRQLYTERAGEMEEYLRKCPIPVVPGLLLALPNGATFSPIHGKDLGVLELERREKSVAVVDGQHRLSGFDLIQRRLGEIESLASGGKLMEEEKQEKAECLRLLDYDMPVIIVDTKVAAEIADKARDPAMKKDPVRPDDVEKVVFTVLNITAKGLRPSLKDFLQYKILSAGIRGIPPLEREPWRANTTRVVIALNANGSPLEGQINLGSTRGLKRPIQLNSFVTSLERLYDTREFVELDEEQQKDYLKTYWSVVKGMFLPAFVAPRDHLLLKTIGVYSMNFIAADVFDWCQLKKVQPSKNILQGFLKPLQNFDWSQEDSSLKAFGGRGGVTEAYEQLLKIMADGGVQEAQVRLEAIEQKRAGREERRNQRLKRKAA